LRTLLQRFGRAADGCSSFRRSSPFKLDGCYLTIQHGQPAFPPAEPRFPVLAISIPVLDQAIEKLRNHGVDLPWGEETNENGRWVMFHDPAGNLVELVEFKK
jgi:predicted enzyme related to lactoylglutathione lyase